MEARAVGDAARRLAAAAVATRRGCTSPSTAARTPGVSAPMAVIWVRSWSARQRQQERPSPSTRDAGAQALGERCADAAQRGDGALQCR